MEFLLFRRPNQCCLMCHDDFHMTMQVWFVRRHASFADLVNRDWMKSRVHSRIAMAISGERRPSPPHVIAS